MSSDGSQFSFNTTAAIRFGSGQVLRSVTEISKVLGSRILLVTDSGLSRLELYKPLVEGLKKLNTQIEIFDSVEADPSLKMLTECVETGKKFNPSGILGFGGGSPMDVAKLGALLLGSNELLDNIWGVGNVSGSRLPLALIPTTAGTGSEVTPVAIITVSEEEKKGVVSQVLLPDIAILDPELTLGLPAEVTATTAIDAIVHAVEAYTSRNLNNNYLSKVLSIEALKLLGSATKTVVCEPHNISNRADMLLGSMFAGMAFANSPVAAVHALAYPIGGLFHVSHGLSNSLIFTHVLRFNSALTETSEDYSQLSQSLFPKIELTESHFDNANEFCIKLEELILSLGLPVRLRDLRIPKSACEVMAKHAMKQTRLLVNNPREINESDALQIYRQAW